MNELKPPKYHKIENKILNTKGKDKALLARVKEELVEYKAKLDFITNRFIRDFGDHLEVGVPENSTYVSFIRDKYDEYARTSRMLRIINFYENK